MSFAQFKENAFDNEHSKVNQENAANQNSTFEAEQSSASALPPGGEQPENPGNPGDPPVPINGLIPILLLSGLVLVVYYQRKNNKINI